MIELHRERAAPVPGWRGARSPGRPNRSASRAPEGQALGQLLGVRASLERRPAREGRAQLPARSFSLQGPAQLPSPREVPGVLPREGLSPSPTLRVKLPAQKRGHVPIREIGCCLARGQQGWGNHGPSCR